MSPNSKDTYANKYSTISPIIPGRTHARKVFKQLSDRTSGEQTLAFYLRGGVTKYRDNTDRELAFRQESNFVYLTGCDIPGASLLAWCVPNDERQEPDDEFTIQTVLFIPDLDEDDVMWSGMPLNPEEVGKELDVSDVQYLSKLKDTFASLPTKTIHVLDSQTLPSEIGDGYTPVTKHFLMACETARLRKTPAEIDLIQKANDISSRAHEGVMKAIGAGDMKSEWEASAIFSYYCARGGARSMAYEVIAANGASAGTLHYIKNRSSFPTTGGEGNLLLLDAGCEYQNYAADITRTFPVGNGGKFSDEAKEIYRIVESMQDEAFMRIKPGTSWESIHLRTHKAAAHGLLKLGILKKPDGDVKSKDFEMNERDDAKEGREYGQLVGDVLDSGITMGFYPHGLGHHLGLDVHDSAIAALPDGRSSHPLAKYLRFRGNLEDGHVVTVEPGIYFNPFLLKPYMDSPFLDKEVLKKYMPVGGVRIEDGILVTANGFHNMTSVPRSIEAIEKLCAARLKQ